MSIEQYLLEEDPFYENAGEINNSPIRPLAQMDETGRNEYWATLALRHCPRLGARTRGKLLKRFGSAYAAIQQTSTWPLLSIPEICIQTIESDSWKTAAKKEWDEAANSDADILLWTNAAYPARLRQLPDPPPLLYCRGDTTLLRNPAIAIVGSRNATASGISMARYLGESLSACGITIVSGMASGIDHFAHEGALAAIGSSIGVLGTGIRLAYPQANRELYSAMRNEGLLLSEFSPAMNPIARNFPIRNRIISGLSLGIVVVEAAVQSGSLITAHYAIEQNREVFAVPGDAMNEQARGCQNLVRQGAHPVFTAEDILRNLNLELRNFSLPSTPPAANAITRKHLRQKTPDRRKASNSHEKMPKTPAAIPVTQAKDIGRKLAAGDSSQQIIAALHQNGAMHVDELAQRLNISINALNSLLLGLELTGGIKRLPGARFEAINGK